MKLLTAEAPQHAQVIEITVYMFSQKACQTECTLMFVNITEQVENDAFDT